MRFPDRFMGAEQALHDAASGQCGFDDFGHDDYREALAVLLDSLDRDLPRGPAEREACLRTIVVTLVSRLYAQAGWTRCPDNFDRPIVRPLFIVGAPRTGTTALHQLLSAAPEWQGLDSWLTRTPMPRPPRARWNDFAEYRGAVAAHAQRMATNPEFKAIHAVAPDDVDECIHLTSQTLVSNTFGSIMHVPSYDAWFRAQDFRPSFARLADNLRLIDANDCGRRWLLKNPSHILNLEELLEVFPDARVVHIHRDPLAAQPSLWSLLSLHHAARDGKLIDRRAISHREIELYRDALMRSMEVVHRNSERVLEVFEHQLVADPLTLAARIYDFAGQPLSQASEAAMAAWIGRNPKGRHGAHRYTAEEFGVTSDELAEQFSAYRRHYGFDRGE